MIEKYLETKDTGLSGVATPYQTLLVVGGMRLHKHIHTDFVLGAALSSAILKSDMVMADWLVNQEPDHATEDCYLTFKVAASGRLDIFKWLTEEGGKIEDGTMVVAAGRGHLKFIQWLGNPGFTNSLFRNHSPLSGISSEAKFSIHTAAINRHLEVAKYLCEEAKKIPKCSSSEDVDHLAQLNDILGLWYEDEAGVISANTMKDVSKNGHLHVVKWLYEEYGSDPEINFFKRKKTKKTALTAMDAAASKGHLDVVKLLHELQLSIQASSKKRKRGLLTKISPPTCTKAAMNGAAANGQLIMIQWLHEHRVEGCSVGAMDKAASGGHLRVVQWLDEHRTEGCSTAAMDGAATNGHLEVLQWLHDNTRAGCTVKAMDGAAKHKHLNIVKWLHENRSEGCTIAAMDGAAESGALNIVEWLHRHRSEGCSTTAMDKASRNSHLHVVQWLFTHRSEGCTSLAMEGAVHASFFEVFLFPHSECGVGCTVETALTAPDNGSPDIYQWILAQYPAFRAEIEARAD